MTRWKDDPKDEKEAKEREEEIKLILERIRAKWKPKSVKQVYIPTIRIFGYSDYYKRRIED